MRWRGRCAGNGLRPGLPLVGVGASGRPVSGSTSASSMPSLSVSSASKGAKRLLCARRNCSSS